jgi:hypothetical protein
MYRNTATVASGNIVPAPSLKPPSENDSSIADMLARKRQQIDLEIDEFRCLKEREFQDFERSLRKQKRGRRRGSGSKDAQKDPRPGALSLLNLPVKQQQTNGVPRQQTEKDVPRVVSNPTTGVQKDTITAELPPTPLKSKFNLSKPPSSPKPTSLSPVRNGDKKGKAPSSAKRPSLSPLSPPNEKTADSFAGVFTPAYLPLLDSRPSPGPVSPKSGSPTRHGSFSLSLPDSASYSSATPMLRANRSNTEPIIPSTSLPSALRTASGTAVRKRKHVTFQLADSAIVEPSSSYEEMPSPSPKDERGMGGGLEEGSPSDEDVPAPRHGLALAVPSPTLKGMERKSSLSSSSPADLTTAIEGGGAGGFFELDEELTSPGLDAGKPFIHDFDDDTSSPIGTRREKAGKETSGDQENDSLQKFEYSGSVPIDIVRPSSSWVRNSVH